MSNLTSIFRRFVDDWRKETVLMPLPQLESEDVESEEVIVPQLVPLRIPTGWIVHWNLFYDIEPVLENGVLKNTSQCNDSEDLLCLQTYVPESKKGVWDEACIDLGWYETKFRAVLCILLQGESGAKEERTKPVAKIETTSVREVQETIDYWLQNWHKLLPRS
ncbi:MAG: hypothetical protein ACRC62_01810 [Microcoleus sp.]